MAIFIKPCLYVFSALIICNLIPTCTGRKAEITRSFACPAILGLQEGGAMPADVAYPHIISFSPQIASTREKAFVHLQGAGLDRKSQLLINGRFVVGERYIRIVTENQAIVRIPKGLPEGKYSAAIKNPDGKTSNEVWFEVKG